MRCGCYGDCIQHSSDRVQYYVQEVGVGLRLYFVGCKGWKRSFYEDDPRGTSFGRNDGVNRVGARQKTAALLTRMDTPLGHAVGNGVEVLEALQVLKAAAPKICNRNVSFWRRTLLHLSDEKRTLPECAAQAQNAIANGRALQKFYEMVTAQGGDVSVLQQEERFPQAPFESVACAA